jgi:hypothetical protein
MWELKPRPISKRQTAPPPAETLSAPAKPSLPPSQPKPRSDGKPAQPHEAPEGQYWRWNERTAASMADAELIEAVRYVLEILRSNGIDDPAAFVGEVDSLTLKEAAQARRAVRMAYFLGRRT